MLEVGLGTLGVEVLVVVDVCQTFEFLHLCHQTFYRFVGLGEKS
jgi:hypothetical protein